MRSLEIQTRTTGQIVGKIYHRGEMVDFVFRGGKMVFSDEPLPLPSTAVRMVRDADGEWFEVGFLSTVELIGNAGTGWTDPGQYARIHLEQSIDLATWNMGRYLPRPTEAGPDGTTWHWGRSTIPRLWEEVTIDLELRSRRARKSITTLRVFRDDVSLPRYPYDVETQMPALQADLIAAGYAGAEASYIHAPYFVEIRTHQQSELFGQEVRSLGVEHDGESVVAVTTSAFGDGGTTITLPSYPYALPGDIAALQQDLRDAGQSGAVVRLMAGEWTVRLPDRETLFDIRDISLHFSPGDPFPVWDSDGVFQGYVSGDSESGAHDNVRVAVAGASLTEEPKQFARLGITHGTRYPNP